MGGAGYIFTGEHDADVMHNSATINLNVLDACHKPERQADLLFVVGLHVSRPTTRTDPDNPNCAEDSAYPAAPDSEYGWEKLFSERLYLAYQPQSRHASAASRAITTSSGPRAPGHGGKEKAPAAICRKVAEAPSGGEIEIWGDGKQTRSFLYIDECLEGTMRLMRSDFDGPVNIGSEEMVTINQLAAWSADIAGKKLSMQHIPGPRACAGAIPTTA